MNTQQNPSFNTLPYATSHTSGRIPFVGGGGYFDMEIWKAIEGYDGYYEVSDMGRVKSLRRDLILKSIVNNHGYCQVSLCRNGKCATKFIHRLVGSAFVSNPENKPCINHLDTITDNNLSTNLEWCTQKENLQHSRDLGKLLYAQGENHPNSKLTALQVLEIKKQIGNGSSNLALAIKYNVSDALISRIKKGIAWKSVINNKNTKL